MKSICFATAGLEECPNALGITDAYRETARVLARRKWRVVVLRDGAKSASPEADHEENHISTYRIDDLVEQSERAAIAGGSVGGLISTFQNHSRLVHAALTALTRELKSSFDFIEFPDFAAVGFIPVQMKKSSRAYLNSRLIVKLLASSEPYVRSAGVQVGTWDGMLTDYMRRYSYENADIQGSVSRHSLKWHRLDGWRIKSTATVCPITCLPCTPREVAEDFERHHEIAFFDATLDTALAQNDLEAFSGILRQIREADPSFAQEYRVSLVWHEKANRSIARSTVSRMFEPYPTEVRVFHTLEEGLHCLKTNARLSVLSVGSTVSPYPLVGCMMNHIPFVAVRRPDVSEVLGDTDLVNAATAEEQSMHRLIRNYLNYGITRIRVLVGKAYRRAGTLCNPIRAAQWYAELALPQRYRLMDEFTPHAAVTVIIPSRNMGKYLGAALDSLAAQTYKNYKIVISDSSSDQNEVRHTRYLGRRHGASVLRSKERGVGGAMNHALRYVDTKYLMEFDADNIALPSMIETFLRSMVSRHDVIALSSYNAQFGDEDEDKLMQSLRNGTAFVPREYYSPVGLCIPHIFLQNVAGDATSIYLTHALKDIGGWPEDIRGHQDWLLWLKLLEAGRRMDVIPEVLYYYRVRQNSLSRSAKYSDLAQISAIQEIIRKQPELFSKHYQDIHGLLRQIENLTRENRELARDSQELYQIKRSLGYKFMRLYGSRIDRMLGRRN